MRPVLAGSLEDRGAEALRTYSGLESREKGGARGRWKQRLPRARIPFLYREERRSRGSRTRRSDQPRKLPRGAATTSVLELKSARASSMSLRVTGPPTPVPRERGIAWWLGR